MSEITPSSLSAPRANMRTVAKWQGLALAGCHHGPKPPVTRSAAQRSSPPQCQTSIH